jgi:hypothetical protein
MLDKIGDVFSSISKKVSGNLDDLVTMDGDPTKFLIKKGAESLFKKQFSGGGSDIIDTRIRTPNITGGKMMGFYTPGKASSRGGGVAGTTSVDALERKWFSRLRSYYFNKKYYS